MDSYFEPVSKYADSGLLPVVRATGCSAGYDLYCAEEVVIPSIWDLMATAKQVLPIDDDECLTLDAMAQFTEESGCQPTLVSTGMKCKLADNEYLSIVPRSSTPRKYWLLVANSPATIDSDYYNNTENEGEIFLQLINLSPFALKIKVGDRLAQGIIQTYNIVVDDNATAIRQGGFGSTN